MSEDAEISTTVPETVMNGLVKRYQERHKPTKEWIEKHASGTLRKNKRIGFSWEKQYKEERVAWEFGWAFEMVHKTKINTGVPITEGDTKSVTEAGWHIERYMCHNIFNDNVYPAYIVVDDEDDNKREGIGIIVEPSEDVHWIPNNAIIFALVAEYNNEKDEWEDAENPF